MSFPVIKIALAAKELGQETSDNFRDELKRNDKVATGKTRDSLNHSVVPRHDRIDLEVRAVSSWPFTDEGRGPGKMPPIRALEKWATARNIGTVSSRRGIAFAIARKIAREGTNKPVPSFTKLPRTIFIETSAQKLSGPSRSSIADGLRNYFNSQKWLQLKK